MAELELLTMILRYAQNDRRDSMFCFLTFESERIVFKRKAVNGNDMFFKSVKSEALCNFVRNL
ncbi:MAG: hypothetical protein V4642_12870 [Bacteroidota bacterium]